MINHQKGVSLINILIIVIVVGIIIGGGFLLLNNERSKTRDAKRMSDIVRIQAAFEFLYNNTASYEFAAVGGCESVGNLVSQCNLSKYMPTIAAIKDPGKFSYIVSTVPTEDDYQITFTLENSYDSYAAGQHVVSPAGIQ
ncbi:MAG: hypothetical protein Q8P20_03345 [bacterium]|nr:hypothetical protein [bacterium]